MAEQNSTQKEKPGLIRQLSLFDSTMMLMGIIIGSGIYMTTGDMAQHIPSAGLLLLAWVVGGLLALFGALSFAELGAAMPHAGGQYIYLREAYSPLWGYLFGWMLFFVAMGGSIATLGAGFARYVGFFFPALGTDNFLYQKELHLFGTTHMYSLSVGHFVAIAAILALSFFNYIGVVFGKWIQNIITVIKIGTLILFIFLGLTIGKTTPSKSPLISVDDIQPGA
ncbi:APC family permease, partial [Planctomycetota bacterium]